MDYFWRKGNINVPSLYTASKAGHYYYGCGFRTFQHFHPASIYVPTYSFSLFHSDWRAYVAFWLACIPTLPGFAGTFGHKMPAGFVHLCQFLRLFSPNSS